MLKSSERKKSVLRIGTAGWTVPPLLKAELAISGDSHLQVYSQIFNCVEINSSFYNDHKPETFIRWKNETPKYFKFAVKLSKVITHQTKLTGGAGLLKEKLEPILNLDEKLGMLLVQLPPSLVYEQKIFKKFCQAIRSLYAGPVAFEPRNESWENPTFFDELLKQQFTFVFADPAPFISSFRYAREMLPYLYFRLHGSPVIYESSYSDSEIVAYKKELLQQPVENWCIFDNTKFAHASFNALSMQRTL